MRRLFSLLPALLVAVASIPSPGVAQGLVCTLLSVPQAREAVRDIASADGETFTVSGPARFRCADGTIVQADSVISNMRRGDLQLIGNVSYQDSVKTLTSDWLNYLDRQGVVFARGNVVLTDREAGSVVRGEELAYRQESEDRPESFTVVEGGRPHATIFLRDTTAVEPPPAVPPPELLPFDPTPSIFNDIVPDSEPDTANAPLEVVADRLEITGESYFVALGGAELERGAIRGSGDEARFNHIEELLLLIGNAHLYDDEIDLKGARIEARMDEETLTDILADEEATLVAEDLTVEAPFLHLLFAEGKLDRMIAKGDTVRIPEKVVTEVEEQPEGEEGETKVAQAGAERPAQGERAQRAAQGERAQRAEPELEAGGVEDMVAEMRGAAQPVVPIDPSRRARIVAQGVRMIADSVDTLAPGQQLKTVIAVGQAFAERIPEGPVPPNIPEILSRDWMKGDTITGHFIPARPREPDPDAIALPEVVALNAPEDGVQEAAEDGDEPQIELERITVSSVNGDAQAFYLRPPEDAEDEPQTEEAAEGAERPPTDEGEAESPPTEEGEEGAEGGQGAPARFAANYLIASVITLILEVGEVTEAEADGDVRGIYLEPTTATPAGEEEPPADRRNRRE